MTKIKANKEAFLNAIRGLKPKTFSGVIHAENGKIEYKAKDSAHVGSITMRVEDSRIKIEEDGILPIDEEGIDTIFSADFKDYFKGWDMLDIIWRGKGERIQFLREDGGGYEICPANPEDVGMHDIDKGTKMDNDGNWWVTDDMKAPIKAMIDKSQILNAKKVSKSVKVDYIDFELKKEKSWVRAGEHNAKSNLGYLPISLTLEGEERDVCLPSEFVETLDILKDGNVSMQTFPEPKGDEDPLPFVFLQHNVKEDNDKAIILEEIILIAIGPKKFSKK